MSFIVESVTWLLCFCAAVRGIPYMKQTEEFWHDWKDWEGVYTECVNKGDFAITFDDGPTESTAGVLDVLKEEGVKATFFVNGCNQGYIRDPIFKEMLIRTHNEGHEIGSHTWSHLDLTNKETAEVIREQMLKLEEAVEEILGLKLTIMRPPFGNLNDSIVDILVNELHYDVIVWSLDTNDWKYDGNTSLSMQGYINAMDAEGASSENSAFIALHHDRLPRSKELAKAAIDFVKRKGYNFVTISECIGKVSSGSSTTHRSFGFRVSPNVALFQMIFTFTFMTSISSFLHKMEFSLLFN